MKVWRDLNALPQFKSSVVTIGSFDGVHQGHQHIIEQLSALAKEHATESILITFHPHPRTVLQNQSVELLTILNEKIEQLAKYGIDHLVIVPFTRRFSELDPMEYISEFIVNQFHPQILIIGYDHRYGKNRAGDILLLKREAPRYNFEVMEISPQEVDNITVSSTKIRTALSQGNILKANHYLGYEYCLSGIVSKGKALGRTIGFPTANIEIPDQQKLIPTNGVYGIRIKVDAEDYIGMMNIGIQPTVAGIKRTIEVNIFNFNRDIYGEQIAVYLQFKLRNEKKFSSLNELKNQLAKDKKAVLLRLK